MKIAVIGTGFVGLTHAAVCAEAGHQVRAFDIDAERIASYRSGVAARIERYVNEPGLSEAISRRLGRTLDVTSDPNGLMDGVDAVFMCVPTPSRPDGSTDRSHYERAAHMVADLLARRRVGGPCVVVNKSTVPVGTARLMERILLEHGVLDVGVASNPEFLPQGRALDCSRRPDRVVVGADRPQDFAILRCLYRRFLDHVRIRYIETTPETAEAIKYVANSLLFSYISFWNGVAARVAEAYDNIHMEDLKIGVTSDARISAWGSYVGVGAGGSCFGKDLLSLVHQLQRRGRSTELLEAVHRINEVQKTYLIERAAADARFDFAGATVAVLGLAFKKNTNDMRGSAALRAIDALLERGVEAVRAYDPLALEEARSRYLSPRRDPRYQRISYHRSPREAVRGSRVTYVATDLEELRELAPVLLDELEPPHMVIDGRRIIAGHALLIERGFQYLTVGGAPPGRGTGAAPLWPSQLEPERGGAVCEDPRELREAAGDRL